MNKTIRSKDFLFVAIGQIISLFGNQILRYALPLYLLYQTGSSALFGSIMATSFIPMILLFPIGGIIADRVNKRNIMVILDLCTAVLITVFTFTNDRIDIVPLMAITMIILYGIQGAYQPAVKASVPVLLDAESIIKGNSIVDAINSLAGMCGPIVGGLLYSMLGLYPILYVSILCFACAAVMEIFIQIPFQKEVKRGNAIKTGFMDMKESFLFLIRKNPILWKISLLFAAVNLLLTSLILIGFPVIITQHLGFSTDNASRLYGYGQGIIAGGAVLGGILTGVLSKKLTARTCLFLLVGCSLSILIAGISLQLLHNTMAIYIVIVVCACSLLILSTVFQIRIMSFIQMLTPHHLLGKIISCVMCVSMCTNPLGQFLYGFIFENIGNVVYIPFYTAAIIMFLITIVTRHIFIDLAAVEANKCTV